MELTEQETKELGGVDVNELIEMDARFGAEVAATLLKEGLIVKRACDKYGWKLHEHDYGCDESRTTDLAQVDETGKVVSFAGWTAKEILAGDFQVMTIRSTETLAQ